VALDAALDEWADVDMQALQQKSWSLCQTFIDLVEANCAVHGVKLAGPRNMAERGSHVSFQHPEGYAVMQALISRGVIGDFRAPDMVRFGFAPLYNTHEEVFEAAAALAEILDKGLWDTPDFRTRKKVT
jgi:kynureninase